MPSLHHTDFRVWESSLILILLQPRHLTFIFPGNNLTNGAGRAEMISSSFFYLSRQLCQLEFKTPWPFGRSGSTQRGRNDLWDLKLWHLSDRISFAKSGLCLITAKKYPWCDLTFYGLFHPQFPHSWWASMRTTAGPFFFSSKSLLAQRTSLFMRL